MELENMYRAVNGSVQTQIINGITATAQEMEVENAAVLPAAPNLLTISTEDGAEVIRYGTKNGNILGECLRGFGGTSAQIWPAGTVCYRAYTAYDHNAFLDNLGGVNAEVEALDDAKQDADTLKEGAFAGFGAGAADIARGNHTHAQYLTAETDPTVPAWAKAASKPVYAADEVGAVPTGRQVNGKALSADIALTAGDVGAAPSVHTHSQYLTEEADPTVPAWAKAASKPTYNAGEVGAVPVTRKVNGKALSIDIELTAGDVNAATANHTHSSYESRLSALETATNGIEALLAAI